jgi:hypothetical protein
VECVRLWVDAAQRGKETAGIADFRLPIAPPWRDDGHWKELPHHFFNRQSAISNRQ